MELKPHVDPSYYRFFQYLRQWGNAYWIWNERIFNVLSYLNWSLWISIQQGFSLLLLLLLMMFFFYLMFPHILFFFSLKSSCFPFLYVSIYFIILSLNINLCHQIHTVGWWLQLIFRKKRKYSESRPVIYDNLAVGAVTHLTRSLTFCKNLKFSIANYYKCLLLRKNKDN